MAASERRYAAAAALLLEIRVFFRDNNTNFYFGCFKVGRQNLLQASDGNLQKKCKYAATEVSSLFARQEGNSSSKLQQLIICTFLMPDIFKPKISFGLHNLFELRGVRLKENMKVKRKKKIAVFSVKW